ncbi:MAG: DMT family transporter [Patescibacteria group bacterium]
MNIEKKKILIGYLCAIGAVIFWGFHPVLIRILINQGLNPYMIGSLRLFIGSLILAIVLAFLSLIKKKPYPKVAYSKFFWIIAVSLAANFLLFHKGLEYTTASDAILLEAFSPVIVLVIVMIFFQQKIKHFLYYPGLLQKILFVVMIGLAGSAFLLMNNAKDQVIIYEQKFIGDIIEFIAMFAWALVMIGMHEYHQREKETDILAATAQFLFVAAVIMIPFVPWGEITAISTQQWMWLLVLGTFSTCLTYILWHTASRYLDIFPLVVLFNFASIFNVITESVVLNTQISWKLFIGGALILYASMRAKLLNDKYKILTKEESPGE